MEEEKPSKNKEKSDRVDRAILAILNSHYKGPTWPWWGPVDEPNDRIKRVMRRDEVPRMIEPIKKSKRQEAVDGPENKQQNERWLIKVWNLVKRIVQLLDINKT